MMARGSGLGDGGVAKVWTDVHEWKDLQNDVVCASITAARVK